MAGRSDGEVAQKPPQGPGADRVTNEALKVRVNIDLNEFYSRLQSRTAQLIADFQQQGLTGQALADAVTDGLRTEFDTSIERAGREATNEAFALGRNVEAQARAADIGEAVRSEILDDNTCEPCSSLDGTVVQMNSPDYFRLMPPNLCDGREQCRGFYIYRAAA